MNRFKLIISVLSFLLSVICFSVPAHSAEKFVVKYDKAIDLTKNTSTVNVDGYTVRVDMSEPAEPFREIVFRVFVEKDKKPVELAHGYMQFNMSMDMGLYKTKLFKANTGYTAKVTLPKCIFGGKRWYAKLVFSADGGEFSKVFLFDMKE